MDMEKLWSEHHSGAAHTSRRGIPSYSVKSKREAWQRAKKAADAVEATALGKREADAPGGAARQERLLLDRLRNESHAEAVGEAWLRIEQHFKKGDEGQPTRNARRTVSA
jgi:hypothetical protein